MWAQQGHSGVRMEGMHSAPGGTSIGAAILFLLKRKKYGIYSEIQTTVFNQIRAAALIIFYEFLTQRLFESGTY